MRPLNWVRSVGERVLLAQAPVGAALLTMLRFGSEEPLEPDVDKMENWHHRRLSHDAALAVGWGKDAAMEMSWHTDYVDSYLYSPLWWFEGGLGRVKASMSLKPTLINVHFDDLTDAWAIERMWDRYRGGMLAGVVWAARMDAPLPERVAMARHIVGTALHPLQDFYSHSNWIDHPGRRESLWTDAPYLSRQPLYTGSYEHPYKAGIKHHGKLAPECSLLQLDPGLLPIMCHPASPMSDSAVCKAYRSCQDAVPLGRRQLKIPLGPLGDLTVPVPKGLVYLDPPGIAVDSRWLAPVGAHMRGFPPQDGDLLMDVALALAERQSAEILCGLTRALSAPDLATFWHHVRHDPSQPREVWAEQFEDFHRQGVRFIGAGDYPPPGGEPPAEEWYMRVRLRTADTYGAGTDADIYGSAGVGTPEVLLDNMPGAVPGLGYDDFEAGDDQVFHLGPFPAPPDRLRLRNDAADLGDIFETLWQKLVDGLRDLGYLIADLVLSLVSGHADHVKTVNHVFTPDELKKVGPGGTPFFVDLNGGAHGQYRVHGTIRRKKVNASGPLRTTDWSCSLERLEALKESEWDRASDSDEPFLMAMLVNQASRTATHHMFGPFSDVDTGESRRLGSPVLAASGVPDDHGHLTLLLSLWESDDETDSGRRGIYRDFIAKVEKQTEPAREGFIDVLGRAIGAAWTVEQAEVTVYGIRRGGHVVVGPTQVLRPGLIKGDEAWEGMLKQPTEELGWSGRSCPRDELRLLDLDGDGRSDVLVTGPRGLAFLSEGNGGGFTTTLVETNTNVIGEWEINTARDRFGPSGHFVEGEPGTQLWVRRPGGQVQDPPGGALGLLADNVGTLIELRHLPLDPNDTDLLPGTELRAGPAARLLRPDRHEAVFSTSAGLAVLGYDHDVVRHTWASHGSDLEGGWKVHGRLDRVVGHGDLDGDGLDELVLHGPGGIAVVKLVDGALRVLGAIRGGQDYGTVLPLDPDQVRVGPVADLRGSGRPGLIVTVAAGHAFVELDDAGRLESTAFAPTGAQDNQWLVDPARDRFGPVGRLVRTEADLWLATPSIIGVVVADGHRLVDELAWPVGESFDDWVPTADTRYGPARAVDGRADSVIAVDERGIVAINVETGDPDIVARASHGWHAGGWEVDTRRNAFQ